MLSPVMQAKFKHFYDVVDTNNDGILNQGDYELSAAKIIQELNLEPDSDSAHQLTQGILIYWYALVAAMNKDRDDTVSQDEWLEYWDYTLNQEAAVNQLVASYGQTMLKVFDQDGDGKLTVEDFVKFFRGHNMARGQAEFAFEKLDANGDGFIEWAELSESAMQYYHSDVLDEPGNYFLGDFRHYLEE